MKLKKAKAKIVYILLASIVLITASTLYIHFNRQNTSIPNDVSKPGPVRLVEDVNNSCGENNLKTTGGPKFIEFQVPGDEVDEYLTKAAEDSRCVQRLQDGCIIYHTKRFLICAGEYLGLSESEAVDRAKTNRLEYRIVERDGQSFPINSDLNEYRLNFTVEDGKVTKVEFY